MASALLRTLINIPLVNYTLAKKDVKSQGKTVYRVTILLFVLYGLFWLSVSLSLPEVASMVVPLLLFLSMYLVTAAVKKLKTPDMNAKELSRKAVRRESSRKSKLEPTSSVPPPPEEEKEEGEEDLVGNFVVLSTLGQRKGRAWPKGNTEYYSPHLGIGLGFCLHYDFCFCNGGGIVITSVWSE